MKKLSLGAFSFVAAFLNVAYVACVDYSDPQTGAEAGAPTSPRTNNDQDAGATPSPPSSTPPSPEIDAGGTCATHSYRGGTANAVVCPGTAKCECESEDVCCMQKLDALSGTCTPLAACRGLALQCDGPEDCDGGVCCLEDRTGGGSSCKSGATCGAGQWLCRTDADCANAPSGPRCAPLDLGTPGVDDVGLDGIVGVCGK
jgi:hypothetical protein